MTISYTSLTFQLCFDLYTQSEGSSGVGVPIMTQRWPTEDGGFLLVQQFRGDGEPAMSRSSSFSDLSSSLSYPGGRSKFKCTNGLKTSFVYM